MFKKRRTYLDYAAAAPVVPAALRAFLSALPRYANPSSAHEEGRAASLILEKARRSIARSTGAKPEQVAFVPGATEGNALAIEGSIRARIEAGARADELEVLYLPGAHASLGEAVKRVEALGVRTIPLPLSDGAIDRKGLQALVGPKTALVTLVAACSETGTRYDALDVRRLLDVARSDGGPRIPLHVDASQLPLVESCERTRLGADLLVLDAQKAGGVRGVGVLVYSAAVPLVPLYGGGGQERGLVSGTKSPALAAAFAAALEQASRTRERFGKRAAAMRAALVRDVSASIPDSVVNEGKENLPHIANFSFPGRDTDYLAALLDERGYAVSTRSACDADSEEGSRAVLAQTGDPERARSTLRISWGPDANERELRAFSRVLAEAVAFLDRTRL